MPDSTKKYAIQQKQADGMLTLHPETEAAVVTLDNVTAGMSATNVQDAFKEVMDTMADITGGGVVTGVKGNKEEEYRMGQVNLTPANIGAVAENTAITGGTATKITYDSKGLVTAGTNLTATDIPDLSTTYIPVAQKGTASGVATLGADGRVPSSQLPSYVDDVIEGYYYDGQFYQEEAHTNQITPEGGKIYVDIGTVTPNQQYRWSGSQYVSISSSLALGETEGTAYEGNKGKQNADNITAIINGTQPVGKATNADKATSATNAGNVTATINGQEIADIFEANGTTVKEATHAASANTAESANKLTTARAISLTGDVKGSANFDGSAPASITATLSNVGTAGTYSVVTTDVKGRVTAGGQIIEVGTTGQDAPSASLAVGGLFFKEI